MATDINELTEESTHDDVLEMVDSIVEARNEEKSDSKSDSKKIAEERDKPTTETTADTGNEEDTASDGDDTGDSEDQDWLDDDLKAEVTARGIDESELADFTSREELDRAMRFLDKSALEAGRKAKAEDVKEEQPKEEPRDGQYEIGLDTDLFDEDLVGEFTKMRDHYETRMAAMEARFQQADALEREQRFDSLVDSMGHKDLFGKSGSESEKEHQRRLDLYEAVDAQQIGMKAQGRSSEINEALVQRVARMVFADELGKKDLKNRTRKLARQSDGRMGGSATKAHDSTESLREQMRRQYKELDDAG